MKLANPCITCSSQTIYRVEVGSEQDLIFQMSSPAECCRVSGAGLSLKINSDRGMKNDAEDLVDIFNPCISSLLIAHRPTTRHSPKYGSKDTTLCN